ncbi:MAG TPA: ACP S-malonyltransferase [Thermoanaerobaculia bacterium]|nr:ACP S-malonyltransferase [Thermoanaerobaculia bacterium]HQR67929.1 ACP S-malonyltransferase [Thermoanaerobaculia bacterium]
MTGLPFAALFPGQLSEKPGMGEAFASRFDFVAAWFEEVSRRSGVDLAATFFGAGSASLHDDLPAQAGVYAVSVAARDVLERVHGLVPAAVAGYSLGTYAAFVAAGVLDRFEALDVLLEAGRLLAEERRRDSGRPGGMGFVVGLGRKAVEEGLDGTGAAIGTVNAGQQFVLTGERAAVEEAVESLRPKALRAEMLPIGLAMHSRRLDDVSRRLSLFLEGRTAVRTPTCSLYVPMLGARVSSREEISSVLSLQLSRPSLWAPTLAAMGADGFSVFAETGPGDVLTKLLRWTLRDARGFVVENPAGAAEFASAMIEPEVVTGG